MILFNVLDISWGQIHILKSKLVFGGWRGGMLRDGAIALLWECKALSLDAIIHEKSQAQWCHHWRKEGEGEDRWIPKVHGRDRQPESTRICPHNIRWSSKHEDSWSWLLSSRCTWIYTNTNHMNMYIQINQQHDANDTKHASVVCMFSLWWVLTDW